MWCGGAPNAGWWSSVAERRLPGALRAWWVLERAALRAQTQYRANLFVGLIGGLTYQGINVVFLALLLSGFGLIGGWGFAELGLLVGIRLAAHSFYVMPFGGLLEITQLVREGEFDLLLLRPVDRFIQIITRRFNVLTVGDGLLGLAALVGFGILAPVEWTWWRLGYVVAAVVGGGLVETAVQMVIGSLAFRGGGARIMQIQADRIVTTFGIYPLTIFGPEGLLFLCFVFPLGFVAYLPTAALLDRAAEVPLPAWLVWASPLMGWVLFPLSLVLFHRMSRHYQSPGA